ncbi:MAG: hypothetical protein U5M51_08390 [Emticicia sp.]|nr:hypothetical protein [Emticicia sp.]
MKTNFSKIILVLFLFVTLTSQAQWEGTWTSTFGDIRLQQNGSKVVGDYAEKGIIEGTIKGKVLSGKFTNANNEGTFEWTLDGQNFKGDWKWASENKLKSGWTGSLKSAQKPALTKYVVSSNPKQKIGIIEKTDTKPIIPIVTNPNKNAVYIGEGIKSKNDGQMLLPVNASNSPKPSALGNATDLKIEKSIDDVLICRVAKQKYKADFNSLYLIRPDANILPGMLISGNAFQNGQIKPIQVKNREPYKITVSGTGNSKSDLVNNYSISGISEVISKNRFKNTIPLYVTYEDLVIESESQFKLGLGISSDQSSKIIGVSDSKSKIGFSFDIRTKKVSKYFLIQYAATDFAVTIDNPELINGMAYYGSDALPKDATVIKEVGYGRLLYFLVKIEANERDISTAINLLKRTSTDVKLASVNNDVIINASTSDNNSNYNLEVKAFGAGIDVVPISVQNFDQLRSEIGSLIKSNKGASAVPIYYKMARAIDYEELSTKIIDESEVRECKINKGSFKVSFDNVLVWETEESGNDEIYGIGWCDIKIKTKQGAIVKVPLSSGKYVHPSQPRIFSIDQHNGKSIAKNDGFTINSPVEYTIDAQAYGYETLEEALKNTKIQLTAELKEEDHGDDTILGKVKSPEFTLNNTFIKKISMGELKNKRNIDEAGILKIQKEKARYGISYSITPLEN